MRRLGRVCAVMLMVAAPACFAQTPHPAKKASKPEPSELDLFNYVRGKLLALSPSDGINDNVEVALDQDNYVLTITQPDGRCDIFLGAPGGIVLIQPSFQPAQECAEPEDGQAVITIHHVREHHVEDIVDAATLGRDTAVHVGLAET